MEGPIRVLLANLPVVMRELFVQQLTQQTDIQLVGYSEDNLDIMLQAQIGVDVILMSAPHVTPPPGICSHILNEFPHVRILIYSLEQDQMTGYWLGVRRCRVQRVDNLALIESIRSLFHFTATL